MFELWKQRTAVALLVVAWCMFAGPRQGRAATTPTYALSVSTSSNHSNALALQGAILSGNVYIFTSYASKLQNYDPSGIRKVCYWLDNTSMKGTATQCDSYKPYDFAGSVNNNSTSLAKSWNTTKVANAPHTITQLVTLSTGGSEVDTATFTISNPTVTLSTTSLAFSGQLVGTTSPPQTVTLTNSGTASLTINGITSTGNYAQSNTCGTGVAVSGKCTIQVTFTPTTTGTRSGSVSITDNAAGSPQQIVLSGNGTAPALSLSSTTLSFGDQAVGTTSAPQTVTLTNSGTAPLTINGITSTGNYAQSNNCGTGVAGGGKCTIQVTFTPTTTGTRSGSVSITDNAVGSPQQIALTGNGTAPAVSLSSTTLSFGDQAVGTSSPPQSVILTNSGTAPLTISGITSTGDYTQSNTCGTGVAVSGRCTIQVTFTPTATGSRSGSVNITDNAAGSPQQIALTGNGTAPAVSLSSTALSFGDQAVGAPSAPQSVTLTNSGTAPLTISGITSTGDYTQSNTCGTGVAVSGKCTIQVTFTPTATGSRSGSVSITDNAAGSPQQIALTGNGTAPALSLSSTTLSFGDQAVGAPSASQSVTLTNSGTAPLTISGITSTGDYTQSNTCGTGVAVSGKCTIQVTFTPTATGSRSGPVSITDNAAGSPQQIALTGNGTTALSISTSSLPGGTVGVAYSASLAASGGTPGYSWSLASGSLPGGLTLSAAGQIAGTPTTTGPYSFTVQVSDSGSPAQTATKSLSISVAATPPPTLSISTSSLLGGTVGVTYSASLAASGGTPGYSWSLASGSLPGGLTLSAAGQIAGTPTTTGPYSFTVQVSDSGSPAQTATKSLSISVAAPPPPPLSISTSSLPNGTVGVAYNATVSATGGTAGYSWSIVSGLLPAGLTMAATSGQISGTPSAAGNYDFTLQVTDSGAPAQTATQSYSVNVAANPPVITTTSLAAVQNSPYTSTLAASGGVPPYAWLLADGSLPAGLTLSSTGVISGTPTVSGTSSFTVGVTDADNQTASQALSITVSAPPAGLTHGPLVVGSNSHWFVDTTGKAVALSGSHTWNNFQDLSQASPPSPGLDYTAYVSFLQAHGHSVTILWRKDLPTFCNWGAGGTWHIVPWPWPRTGPGTASDGQPKFDLSQFNQAYFDRLRARVIALQQAGIYAIVQLFDGLQLMGNRCGTTSPNGDGYPFTGINNINGVDDGYSSGVNGPGSMTMSGPNAITNIQDAYVQKTIDTLNDLDNVIWEASEEAPDNSTWWQGHMIELLHVYEGGGTCTTCTGSPTYTARPYKHPVLYASLNVSSPNDSALFSSAAESVAPYGKPAPTNNQGKVIIEDSDHNYFGMWNDSAQVNRNYFWESFTNGASVIFMEPYEIYWSSGNRNLCGSPTNGVCSSPDPRWDNLRNNLGYIVSYGNRMNLLAMTPQPTLSSTGYALANASAAGEYLVYAPNGGSFTVNLSATPGSLSVEWFNPSNISVTTSGTVPGGSNNVPFTPPFTGDAVLYLKAQ